MKCFTKWNEYENIKQLKENFTVLDPTKKLV